jgi:hypothetical protein
MLMNYASIAKFLRSSSMISLRKITFASMILGIGLPVLGFGFVHAQDSPQAKTADAASTAKPAETEHKSSLPAYHSSAPTEPLPDTLDPKQFPDAQTQNIYALAAKEKSVLYQQPCFCRCDKEVGHKSLLDCYVDAHASHCILCKKEAVFAYTETQAGKTAAQIRKEIMDGKWKTVDLSQYDTLAPVQ